MFIASLFTIVNVWKQIRFHQQKNGSRRYGTHIMEYYSDIKKNEIIPFAAT